MIVLVVVLHTALVDVDFHLLDEGMSGVVDRERSVPRLETSGSIVLQEVHLKF